MAREASKGGKCCRVLLVKGGRRGGRRRRVLRGEAVVYKVKEEEVIEA